MGVSANAITLPQYAIMSNDPLVLKITYSLLVNGIVLEDVPLVTNPSMKINGVRWKDNLPSPTWAKLNTEPTVTSGTPTAYQEQAYLMRNAIDVDVKLVEDKNQIVDPRGAQLEAYLKGVAYDFNDKFINNDHISGEDDCFIGLRYRLDNPTTFGTVSEMKIDAGGVDLTQGNMTAATANNFIEFIQQILDYMGAPDGTNVVFYMNDLLKRRWERAIRLLGAGAGFAMTKDAFDRTIERYKGARIVDVGRKADQSTRIITSTETAAGAAGSSNYTSLYAVRYGEDSFMGWQFASLADSIQDLGRVGNAGTIYRTLIDWAVGLAQVHTRGVARLYDIKVS